MPAPSSRTRAQLPIKYRDPRGRVWLASEIAQLRVVSPAIDGPNRCLVIRFEREGEERFAHWIGGEEWREREALHRLFAETEPDWASPPASEETATDREQETGVGQAPADSVALWVKRVGSMGPDELALFEEQTLAAWDRASLGDLVAAIRRRRRELAG